MANWFKLDVAANMFPSVSSNSNSSVYRLAAVMNDEIDRYILQKAVDKIIDRFPMYFVKIKKGVFWNYLDTHSNNFSVEEESSYPCQKINPVENKGYLIRILYYKNRISVEMYHALSDGGGSSEFLKALLYYYICFRYKEIDSEGKVLLFDDDYRQNIEDSFRYYFGDVKPDKSKQKIEDSYHIKGTRYLRKGNNITTGVLSASDLNKIAKTNNVKITAYLVSALIYSIYHAQQRYDDDKKPIVISVPANLRNVFPSKTLKNFFTVVNIKYYVNRETTFEDILKSVSEQILIKTTRDNLAKSAAMGVAVAKNIFSKYTPLFVKNFFLHFSFDFMSERKKTITLSNIGNITIPSGMEEYISHFEAIIYPTPKSPINCGVIAVNNRLTINFARTIKESDILSYFFRTLGEQGLDITVYSNNWEGKYE